MAEFPALPFFTDAYLADTRHLTTEEHGAYLLLLMCAWRTRGCVLKDEDRQLARIAGVSPTKWKRLRPVLADFFTVSEGVWRQKKLTSVYETVARKVERNRANGAKGGRTTAARFTVGWPVEAPGEDRADAIATAGANGRPPPQPTGSATNIATKTKAKTKSSLRGSGVTAVGESACSQAEARHGGKAQDQGEGLGRGIAQNGRRVQDHCSDQYGAGYGDDALEKVAAAAGLDPKYLDPSVLTLWQSAGVALEADLLPTVQRVATRQVERTGQVPQHLSYYSKAVLEARDKRVGAVAAGTAHAVERPARKAAIRFNRTNTAHWRRFLGDPQSRFRGDYLSQNWRIKEGHPDFEPAGLGTDPRLGFNASIPKEIYETYGPNWGWRTPDT